MEQATRPLEQAIAGGNFLDSADSTNPTHVDRRTTVRRFLTQPALAYRSHTDR